MFGKKRRWKWGIVGIFAVLILILAMLAQQQMTKSYVDTIAKNQEPEEKAEEKNVFLTFDDGPGALTDQYLDLLKAHHAKATFFIIGNQAEHEPELIRRILREGHEIGIHTYSHEAGEIYQSADAYYQDASRVRELLEERFHYQPRFWRFPWGSANGYLAPFKGELVDRLHGDGLEYVDWNVSAEDSIGTPSVESILQNVSKDCFRVDEPVLLMHDSDCCRCTLDSLETILTMLEEKGYRFRTISQRTKPCHFGERT